jgi:hypothetical protein
VERAADSASDVWERLVADLIDLAEHSCQDTHTGEYCVACEAALRRAKEALNDES